MTKHRVIPLAIGVSAVAMLIVSCIAVSAAPKEAPAQQSTTANRHAPANGRKERIQPRQRTSPAKELAGKAETAKPVAAQPSTPTAAKLKDIVTAGLDRFITEKADQVGVAAFYKDRAYAPLWVGSRAADARAAVVEEVLRSAGADGLDPASYPIPDFREAAGDDVKLAAAELKLTNSVLTYARQAESGRFKVASISTDIEAVQAAPNAAEVLRRVVGAKNAGAVLRNYNPQQLGYKALRAKLAELRAHPARAAVIEIPAGPVLKPGARDKRVPLLRRRLGIAGSPKNDVYDSALVAAVRKFQAENGAKPSGMIGRFTLSKLNAHPHGDPIATVIANMERWRWLPRDLGRAYVMVNIPDYSLKVVRDSRPIWETRVVVGKPATATPIFSAQIDNILLNPTWHVPESIIYNEYLPALERDPHILDRMGLVLVRAPDGRIVVQQPPGEDNALGQMKFNFPNRFQVYLHDTPQKKLFNYAKRAFSHGCMRVEDPAKFGEVLLSLSAPNMHYTEADLKQAWGGPQQWIKLPRKIPVHLVYMTAFVDDRGQLALRDDVYGLDQKVTAALKGDQSVFVAEAAAEQSKPVITDDQRRELATYVDGGPAAARVASPSVVRRGQPVPMPRQVSSRASEQRRLLPRSRRVVAAPVTSRMIPGRARTVIAPPKPRVAIQQRSGFLFQRPRVMVQQRPRVVVQQRTRAVVRQPSPNGARQPQPARQSQRYHSVNEALAHLLPHSQGSIR